MSHVIVTFGNVPIEATEHLFLHMKSKGLEPKIMPFDPGHLYEDWHNSFEDSAYQRAVEQLGWADDESPEFHKVADEAQKQLLNEYFSRTLSCADVNSVYAVIMPMSEYGLQHKWVWATRHFPDDYREYTVQVSECDGSFWLSGVHSLPYLEAAS